MLTSNEFARGVYRELKANDKTIVEFDLRCSMDALALGQRIVEYRSNLDGTGDYDQ